MTVPSPPPPRAQRLDDLSTKRFDAVVVGGGITGAGVALDLKARGLNVALIEADDWAAHTSSASSRLIHGGLRYLEHYEFGLVRESCLERAWLLDAAAGMVWPEVFSFPLHKGDRVGPWKLRAGLWLYTLLSMPRRLGWPSVVSKPNALERFPGLDPEGLKGAGSYLDGATDDARLTLSVVRTSLEAGVVAASRIRADKIADSAEGVAVQATDQLTGRRLEIRAARAVLCGGPFTEALRARAGLEGRWISSTRGGHVILDRARLPTEGAVIFTSKVDGRAMFLIPWANRTVIGTTDLDTPTDKDPSMTREEVDYLLASANGLAPEANLTSDDVLSAWSGLRPLLAAPDEDPSARSREERVVREGNLFTIAGGKLTGFRSMAEPLGADLCRHLGRGDKSKKSPTRRMTLWGALPEREGRSSWSRPFGPAGSPEGAQLRSELGDSKFLRAAAYRRRYGVHAPAVEALADGSAELDAETLLGEVRWAVEQEDALSVTDFLLRRTDVGYGALADLDRAAPMVLDEMASLLDWNEDQRAAEESELGAALDRMHGWRAV